MISLDTLRNLPTYLKPASHQSLSPEDARAWERRRRAMLTAFSAMVARGFSLLFPILTIHLFLKGLGLETYGLWMTVNSFFALFAFADLGLGSGLLTRLSQAFGREDLKESVRLVTSAFFMLSGIACLLLVLACCILPWVPWGRFLNAASAEGAHAAPWIVWSVVGVQLLQIPFATVSRTQLALQKGYKNQIWQMVGVALNLAMVFILVHIRCNPLFLITTTALVPILAVLANWLYFFMRERPDLRPRMARFDRKVARSLLNTGSGFFLLAILLAVGMNFENFVVSRVCGVHEVPAYYLASRIASVLGMVAEMLSFPMWSAFGEALARGDHTWVRRTSLRLSALSGLLTLAGGALLVGCGPWVFHHWLGKELTVGRELLIFCALRAILQAAASPFFMVLNGAGVVRPQVAAFLVFTPVLLTVQVILARHLGSGGVALGMALLYGLYMLPWVYLRAMKVCKAQVAAAD